MNLRLPRTFALLATLLAALGLPALAAAEDAAKPAAPAPASPAATPAVPAPVADFRILYEKITAKLKAGQQTEQALADEIKGFDELLAKYANEKTDDVAMIGIMKARLYLEVFDNTEKGIAILKQVKADFPATHIASKIDGLITQLEQKAAKDAEFALGKPFPAIDEKDLDGKPLSLAALKGKVVLIDFWATWCGPCVGELPNVTAAYQKFHGKGFEIVGVSLDDNRDKLTGFLKDHGMTWAQFFDGQGWHNKLAQQFGINSIPATFLLDKEGKIVAKDLRGPALDKKLGELLGQ